MQTNSVYCGNSKDLIRKLEAGSIDLSFWSPPYFVGKDYEKDATYESWQELLRQVIHGHGLALKPGGFMVVNIADILCFADDQIPRFQSMNISMQRSPITREMVLTAREDNPTFNRHQLAQFLNCSEQTIDRRLNGNNIRGGKYNVQTKVKLAGGSLEKYAEEAGLYLYDKRIWVKDPAWANSRWVSNSLKAVSETEDLYIFWKPGETIIDRSKLSKSEWKEWGSRQIWKIPSVKKNDDHQAKFPLELASRVVRLYSSPRDTVLDPFLGSGTTAIAAIHHDRKYIGFELQADYFALAKNNIDMLKAEPKLPL